LKYKKPDATAPWFSGGKRWLPISNGQNLSDKGAQLNSTSREKRGFKKRSAAIFLKAWSGRVFANNRKQ